MYKIIPTDNFNFKIQRFSQVYCENGSCVPHNYTLY